MDYFLNEKEINEVFSAYMALNEKLKQNATLKLEVRRWNEEGHYKYTYVSYLYLLEDVLYIKLCGYNSFVNTDITEVDVERILTEERGK